MEEVPLFDFGIIDDFDIDINDDILSQIEVDDVSESRILDDSDDAKNKNRFAILTENDLDKIVETSESTATKKSTKWGVKIFEDWCTERGITKSLPEFDNKELDEVLRKFYAEARPRDSSRECYSRSSLLSIRAAIERYLSGPPFNRNIKITRGDSFQLSNKMLNSKIKTRKMSNKENVQHKPAITIGHLRQLFSADVLNAKTPLGLLRNVWFNTTLYWCRRGRENQRKLTADSFIFEVDDEGKEYARMNVDESTKNHPGGIQDAKTTEKLGRMYSTSHNRNIDGLACLKMYIQKCNPNCSAFFQYPRAHVTESDQVWFENRPLGINKLGSMMKEISGESKLSTIYTNHSVRATAITLWSDAQVPSRHIMNISGHRNEESIKHYNTRPSSNQLRTCSNILSEACAVTASVQPSTSTDYTSSIVPAFQGNQAANQFNESWPVARGESGYGLFKSCQINSIVVNQYLQK